jgi:sodium transport system ATP-binding protein
MTSRGQPDAAVHWLFFGQHGGYDRMSAQELVGYFGRLYGLEEKRLRVRMEEVFTALQMNDFGTRWAAR